MSNNLESLRKNKQFNKDIALKKYDNVSNVIKQIIKKYSFDMAKLNDDFYTYRAALILLILTETKEYNNDQNNDIAKQNSEELKQTLIPMLSKYLSLIKEINNEINITFNKELLSNEPLLKEYEDKVKNIKDLKSKIDISPEQLLRQTFENYFTLLKEKLNVSDEVYNMIKERLLVIEDKFINDVISVNREVSKDIDSQVNTLVAYTSTYLASALKEKNELETIDELGVKKDSNNPVELISSREANTSYVYANRKIKKLL